MIYEEMKNVDPEWVDFYRPYSNIGGNFGSGQLVNHISYADDRPYIC